MFSGSDLKLFWWSMYHLHGRNVENFGDILSKHIIENITGKTVIWQDPRKIKGFKSYFNKTYFAIGSILHFATSNCIIWGSGLIDSKSEAPDAKYCAVRGPLTSSILKNRGIRVPEKFGDPGLLTSRFFYNNVEKNHKLGIIPHYSEYDDFNLSIYSNFKSSEIKLIDLRKDVRAVIDDILSCELILSSSLHGIIVPISYGIPAYRFVYSDKIYGDGIKFLDFFKSVGIESYDPIRISHDFQGFVSITKLIEANKKKALAKKDIITIQDELLSVCPV